MSTHSAEYTAYMQSAAWRKRKAALYAKRGYACQRCGVEGEPVEVHHLDYARLGHELDSDLLIVCKPCHVVSDKERRELEDRHLFQMKFEEWAKEKHGLFWRLIYSPDSLIEEFHQWQQMNRRDKIEDIKWIVM